MTTLNTIIEEEKKEFEARFCNERICKCCLNKECNHSTTGCPWYQNDVFLHTDNAIQIKAFLTTAVQRAYEAGRTDWLRSEIESVAESQCPHCGYYCTGKTVFCTKYLLITRYKEELKELEK